jgi:CheY-like chemotaxis protein
VRARILVAEDPFVSSFLRTVLQRHGHDVVTCEAGYASERLIQGSVAADVVITNDPEAFLPSAGTVHLLYIAANPDLDLAAQFPACRVLRKPFRNHELLEAIEDLTHNVVN